MGAQRGRDLLLKIADGGAFVTVAGLRARRLALGAEAIDVTSAESPGRWRELLDGGGLRRASLSGAGVFKDAASDALVRARLFDGALAVWQVTIPDFGRIEGPFQVTSLEWRGDHLGELAFDLSMESAGALAFAAI